MKTLTVEIYGIALEVEGSYSPAEDEVGFGGEFNAHFIGIAGTDIKDILSSLRIAEIENLAFEQITNK